MGSHWGKLPPWNQAGRSLGTFDLLVQVDQDRNRHAT
jgi:hypothetical protein